MEREEVRLELELSLNGELHLHHHHHHLSQPGVTDILNLIQDVRNQIMTQLDLSTAKETQDAGLLLTAVQALETAFTNLLSQNNTALQAALDAANLDSTTQAAILDTNDGVINAELAKVNALLNPAGNGGDTGTAGGGTDTNGGGDTTTGTDLTVVASFSDGTVDQPYTGGLTISGGTAPYSVIPDTPSVNGLTMDSTGAVTGTPTVAGGVSFSGTVADSASPANAHATFSGTFTVAEAVVAV
jgi:hypothetical protein